MIKTTILWNDPVKAPIKIGQNIGTININIPGRNTLRLNLVSKDYVGGLGPIDKMFPRLPNAVRSIKRIIFFGIAFH